MHEVQPGTEADQCYHHNHCCKCKMEAHTEAERMCRRWPSLAGKRRAPEWPESPEPLVPLTKELVTLKRMRLRGTYDTRIAALGGANLRPASPAGVAWKISLGSSKPCAVTEKTQRESLGSSKPSRNGSRMKRVSKVVQALRRNGSK